MSKTKELEADMERHEIESKKEWRALSANNLYDMYMDKKKGSNEFSLHAKGTMKIKTPPPPIDPPGDIQGTLNLILQKLNQHDQYFAEVKNDISQVKSEIKNTNKRIDNLKSNVNKRFDKVESEVKNTNQRIDEVKSEVKKINKRIDTIVELNHLKTDDNHQ